MKRVFILALAVLMVLSVCSVSAFADAAEEPDEAAAIEFNHKVFEANRLDTLFGRHESLTFSFVYPEEPGRTWFVWETSDCMYQEWGTQAAQLDRDRVVYAMNCDEETGAVSVHCGVNVEPDYNPFYSFVRETEEAFFDPAHDHVTRIWEEDGAIHGASQFDETLSRDFVENELGLEYTGQTIRTELTLDAETYELLKSVETMVQDGKETVVCVIDMEYDMPEPLACRTLRAPFERNTENAMTVNYFVDAGSDHAFSRTLTLPVNTEAGMVFGDVPVVFFNDPKGETLAHWDRMSDLTMYLFTNPDEELSAGFRTLYDKLMQEMRSAEPDAGTFEKLVAANSAEEVLSRHENFTMTRSVFRDDAEIYSAYEYRDADTYFWGYSDGSASLLKPDLTVLRNSSEQGSSYVTTIYDTPETCASTFEYWKNSTIIYIPETELLLETRDTGTGAFVAVTKTSDPVLVEQALTEHASRGGCEYAEGMSLRFEYTFDKETGDLLALDTFLIDAQGESTCYSRDSYAYNVEVYDPAAEGEPFAEYKTAVASPELSRTISVTFAPDTGKERTIACDLPNAGRFRIICDGQYVKELYTDRACTQLFTTSDGVSDLELYVK